MSTLTAVAELRYEDVTDVYAVHLEFRAATEATAVIRGDHEELYTFHRFNDVWVLGTIAWDGGEELNREIYELVNTYLGPQAGTYLHEHLAQQYEQYSFVVGIEAAMQIEHDILKRRLDARSKDRHEREHHRQPASPEEVLR